jgi:hypothetical protein
MKRRLLVFIFLGVIALSACAKPKIDTSSDEAMKKSIAKVRDSLPEDRRARFDEALKIVTLTKFKLKIPVPGVPGINVIEEGFRQTLHGKTGDEIIAEAEVIEKERQERERAQALGEIKELEERQIKAEADKSELTKFQVLRSKFYKKKMEPLPEMAIIELTVTNGTQYSVSRAYFRGTLASPGRAVPWLTNDFSHQIRGGIEPGETATWQRRMDMFSQWAVIQVPSDAILTVEVLRIDGPKGEALFSSREFSEKDAKRLAELKQKYKE